MARQLCLILAALAMGCETAEPAPPPPVPPTVVCPPGDIPEDQGCRSPGVPESACGEGFVSDGAAGCTATLPDSACPAGTMAIMGETLCREVAPCGDGPWGDVPIDATTQHVDASYPGGDSDGSAARPWTTIAEGVAQASPGAIVAIAAGSYAEDVTLTGKAVRLWGRCPALVEIVGSSLTFGAVTIIQGAGGSEVRDLSLRGAALGIAISAAQDVLLDRLWIHDTGRMGVAVEDALGQASARVNRSLIEAAHEVGIRLVGASVQVEETVIRDVQPDSAGKFGRGIDATASTAARADLRVFRTLVERNHDHGIRLVGGDGHVEATLVRGTRSRPFDGAYGRGIDVENAPDGDIARLTLTASVLTHNRQLGMYVLGSEAYVDTSVFRDTQPQAADLVQGRGLAAEHDKVSQRSRLELRDSLVAKNHDGGILIGGSDALIERTLVRGTLPQASDQRHGRGIVVQTDLASGAWGFGEIRDSAVEDCRDVGLAVLDSEVIAENIRIERTQSQLSNGAFGDGLAVVSVIDPARPARATVIDSRISESARAGIATFSAQVSIRGVELDCNAIHLDGESFLSGPFTLTNDGENRCGCMDADVECHVLTSMLEAPTAVP